MMLKLLAFLMLVLITLFQSMQGLFAALILLVLSVISSAVAFGFYEDLYHLVVAQWLPETGEAVSLMAIFLVTLLVLRLVVDFGIRGNVVFPQRVDKAGAVVFGFFAAMIMTGTTMVAIQMLPFGPQILGYSRLNQANGQLATSGLWFGPDTLAVGLARVIVDGPLAARGTEEGTFEEMHPDFLAQVDARRTTGSELVGNYGNAQVTISQVWATDAVFSADGREKIPAAGGRKFVGLTVDPGKLGTDPFAPAQIRLVTRRDAASYILRAAGASGAAPQVVEPVTVYNAASKMNLVFEIPNTAEPWYLTFKYGSRTEIPEPRQGEVPPTLNFSEPAPAAAATPAPQASAAPTPAAPQIHQQAGRTGAGNVVEATFSNQLPIGIPRSELAGSVEATGNSYRNGQIAVDLGKIRNTPSAFGGIRQFEVPADQRMLQVWLEPVRAGSLFGRAINFADLTMMQGWVVADANGRPYHPVGAFVVARSGGRETLEIQYNPENLMAGRTIGGWQRIQDADLKSDDTDLVLLYHIPTGTKIVEFRTGRNTADLSELNLVAQ